MAQLTHSTNKGSPAADHTSVTKDIQDIGSAAKRAAADGVEAVRDTAQQYLEHSREYLDQGRAKARELAEDVRSRVKEQPAKGLLVAAAVGFVLGIFFARR